MNDSRRAALLKPTAEGRDLGFSRGVVALASNGSVSLSFSGFPFFLNGTNYLFVEGVGSEFFKLDYPSFRGVLAKGDEARRSVAVVYIVQKEAIIVLYGRFYEIGMNTAEVKKYAERFFFGENGVAKTKSERFCREGKRDGEARSYKLNDGGANRETGGKTNGFFDFGEERSRGGNIETRATDEIKSAEKRKIDGREEISAKRKKSEEYDDEVVATDNYFCYDAASRGREYRGESQKDQDARTVGREESFSQEALGGDFACENEICKSDSIKGFFENERFDETYGERIVKGFSNYGEARIVGERSNAADQEGADVNEGGFPPNGANVADEWGFVEKCSAADEERPADEEKGDPEFERRFFFESVRKEMDELFESFPKEESLSKMVAESKWVKVSYEGEKSYVVGIIYSEQTPLFICYGVPGKFGEKPSEFKGYCSFIPSSPFALEKDGYWVIYQDARTGERI